MTEIPSEIAAELKAHYESYMAQRPPEYLDGDVREKLAFSHGYLAGTSHELKRMMHLIDKLRPDVVSQIGDGE